MWSSCLGLKHACPKENPAQISTTASQTQVREGSADLPKGQLLAVPMIQDLDLELDGQWRQDRRNPCPQGLLDHRLERKCVPE